MTHGDRTTASNEQLANWMSEWAVNQRWFGDKARQITSSSVAMSTSAHAGGVPVTLAVMQFSFDSGPDALYFMPVVTGDTESPNALERESFLRWLVDGFGENRVIEDDGTWTWRVMGEGLPNPDAVNYANARLISGEQSNSSIVFDEKFIGKVFRRVQPGLNPDLEIGEFLSHGDRFPHAPRLYGVIEIDRDGERIAIAAMQEFVPNRGDGWAWLLAALRDLSPETSAALVRDIRLLGQRTAELHVALASDSGDDAFAPEPFTETDAQTLIGRVIAEIQESVEGLARRLPPHEVQQIHQGMGQLMGSAHSMVGTHKIRVHGDYHLGQTLRTQDDDFVLIDFEGEPSRTMEQRRMKLSALKDVAGMVRSLDYAGATILMDVHDAERRRVLESWVAEASEVYVEAYRETIGTAAVSLVPEDDATFGRALDLMIAEKALYEVRYELNNRPAWLPIPLNALRRLVGMDMR